jgi:hypothetical protein
MLAMNTIDGPGNLRIEIKLRRHPTTGMWRAEAYAHWEDKERGQGTTDYIDGSAEDE